MFDDLCVPAIWRDEVDNKTCKKWKTKSERKKKGGREKGDREEKKQERVNVFFGRKNITKQQQQQQNGHADPSNIVLCKLQL